MEIDREAIEALEEIEDSLARVQKAVDETERALRAQKEHLARLHGKFQKLLFEATDKENAVVINGRAYWMSGGAFCHVNLKRPGP